VRKQFVITLESAMPRRVERGSFGRGTACLAVTHGRRATSGRPVGPHDEASAGPDRSQTRHVRHNRHRRPAQQRLRRCTATPTEEGLPALFFFDMLEQRIYLARRGMVAMSLPVGEAECDRFAQAVDAFSTTRGPLMRA
jgi:hypothetical protein